MVIFKRLKLVIFMSWSLYKRNNNEGGIFDFSLGKAGACLFYEFAGFGDFGQFIIHTHPPFMKWKRDNIINKQIMISHVYRTVRASVTL